MRQKRLQGSHFASLRECRAVTHLVATGQLDPCATQTLGFRDLGTAHQLLFENRHPPGNMSVLVNAPRPGLVDLPDADRSVRPPEPLLVGSG